VPRRSAASINQRAAIDANKRPPPPSTLDKESAEEWNRVVSQLPATWFPPETQAMLEDRCRHVVWNRFIASQISEQIEAKRKGKGFNDKLYGSLLKSATYHSRILAMLDTKMRLTQQASHDAKKLKRSARVTKIPWSHPGAARNDTNSGPEEC
jgi:hypothetical protein